MKRKTSKAPKASKKEKLEGETEEDFAALTEIAAMAEDFGTDIDTISEHFEQFIACGILQPDESGRELFSADFREAVYKKVEETPGEELTDVSAEEVEKNEVRLMEAVGYVTLERLIEHGMLDLEDEKELELQFEKLMKSMLFLLSLSGEFDAMLEKIEKEKEGKEKGEKKAKAKKIEKGKKKK